MTKQKQQNVISRYCEISTCSGIVDWYLETRCLGKAFWACITLFGLVITFAQTYTSFYEFFTSQRFDTSISKTSLENGIPFPNVTVCNFNRAKKSLIERDSVDPKVLTYIFQLFPVLYEAPLKMSFRGDDFSAYLRPYQEAYDSYINQTGIREPNRFFQLYGHNITDTFVKNAQNGILSDITDLEEVMTVYGRCWKINSRDNQVFPGATFGISLLLDPMLEEYLENIIYNNYFQQGFALSLSDAVEPNMPNTILLAPGTATNVNVKPIKNSVKKEHLPRYKTPCNKKPKLTILNETYTPVNCLHDCYMQAIYSVCGCVLFGNMLKKYPLCNLSTAINCPFTTESVRSAKLDRSFYQQMTECTPTCQMPCYEYTTYETSTSTTKFGYASYQQAVAVTKNVFKRDFNGSEAPPVTNAVSVKIFFASDEITSIETGEKISIVQFISDTGGQLGLWMGLSIFSIIQFLYYFLLACFNGDLWCASRKKNEKSLRNLSTSQRHDKKFVLAKIDAYC